MVSTDLVIPSSVPWDSLKGRELEECLYWLLDSMGFRDIEWRQGGKGQGAADQGRDIEAVRYTESPDGGLEAERWWVEAKGRRGTPGKSVVRDAVLNAEGRRDIDVLVVATNTQFSNPTRDWVREWQCSHPRPRVRLWERNQLERMIVRHPSVVARLFATALSLEGRLEAVRSRFSNEFQVPGSADLEHLWARRMELSRLPRGVMLPLIAGEIANGDLSVRPWSQGVDNRELLLSFAECLVNLPAFILRSERGGCGQSTLLRAVGHVLMVALHRLTLEAVWGLIEDAYRFFGMEQSEERRELTVMSLEPVVAGVVAELRRACVSHCERVHVIDYPEEHHPWVYWLRFAPPDVYPGAVEPAEEGGFVWCETPDGRCNVGFRLDSDNRCPLLHMPEEPPVSPETLSILQKVLQGRVSLRQLERSGSRRRLRK